MELLGSDVGIAGGLEFLHKYSPIPFESFSYVFLFSLRCELLNWWFFFNIDIVILKNLCNKLVMEGQQKLVKRVPNYSFRCLIVLNILCFFLQYIRKFHVISTKKKKFNFYFFFYFSPAYEKSFNTTAILASSSAWLGKSGVNYESSLCTHHFVPVPADQGFILLFFWYSTREK